MIRRVSSFAAAVALAATSPAMAHHGWSSFDAEKPLRLTQPLRNISWGNPHGSAKVLHGGRTWNVILPPMRRVEERAAVQAMLTSSRPMTVIAFPRKDGSAEMRLRTAIVDGKTVCAEGVCGSLATSPRSD